MCAAVSSDLRHHASAHDAEAEGVLLAEQARLADYLRAVGGGHRPFAPALPDPESAWTTSVLAHRQRLSAPNRELDETRQALDRTRHDLESRLALARQQVANMEGSTSWRITAPLRAAVSAIEDRRH